MWESWPLHQRRRLPCADLRCKACCASASPRCHLPGRALPPTLAPGYTSRRAIPRDILAHEEAVLEDLFDKAADSGSFGRPPQRPAAYSRVCVANVERAGQGGCRGVKPGAYRVHTLGFKPDNFGQCDHKVRYVWEGGAAACACRGVASAWYLLGRCSRPASLRWQPGLTAAALLALTACSRKSCPTSRPT